MAWLVLAVLALPLLTAGMRIVTHFVADFSDDESYQGIFEAEGGVIQTNGVDDVFELGKNSQGDGVLQVLANPGTDTALLLAALDEPAQDGVVHVDFDMETLGDWTKLVVWFNDSDGGGIIDIVADRPDPGDSPIRVGGMPVPLPQLDPGDTRLHVRLTLKQPSFGIPSWTVQLTSSNGTSEASGPLFTGGEEPSIGSILFERPGLSLGGTYELDDVIVSSQSGGLLSNL